MKTLTLTVSQFNTFIKNILDSEEFLSGIAITGEVTNFKVSGANTFFDIKDSGAMISCVKFGLPALTLKNGDFVTVYGRVNFYVKSGRVTFVTSRAELAGMGELYQRFIMLKDKLEKEGLFRTDLKKPIPAFAKKIGVVTSETGAVIKDIINVTRSKNPYVTLVVFPSKMQGDGAEREIENGIRYFNSRTDIDTIIVARGGGSLEDLAPFNTETVARAVFASDIPVISAVGHETDFTLCDFASDLRVPTPSVAAEVAVYDYYELCETVTAIQKQIGKTVEAKLRALSDRTVFVEEAITNVFKVKLSNKRAEVFSAVNSIDSLIERRIAEKKSRLEILTSVISKQNPLERLKLGYAAVEHDGKRVSSANDLQTGDLITLTFFDGKVGANVCEKIKGEKNGV